MPLPAETRRRLSENDAKWPVKLVLRAVATFLAFLGMILFAVAASFANQDFIDENDWTDGMTLAPVRQANSPPFPAAQLGIHMSCFYHAMNILSDLLQFVLTLARR